MVPQKQAVALVALVAEAMSLPGGGLSPDGRLTCLRRW